MEHKQRLIKKVIDMFFDQDAMWSEDLRERMALWLLDETDRDIKDLVMFQKFGEITDKVLPDYSEEPTAGSKQALCPADKK